jgi:hypothetical protein
MNIYLYPTMPYENKPPFAARKNKPSQTQFQTLSTLRVRKIPSGFVINERSYIITGLAGSCLKINKNYGSFRYEC